MDRVLRCLVFSAIFLKIVNSEPTSSFSPLQTVHDATYTGTNSSLTINNNNNRDDDLQILTTIGTSFDDEQSHTAPEQRITGQDVSMETIGKSLGNGTDIELTRTTLQDLSSSNFSTLNESLENDEDTNRTSTKITNSTQSPVTEAIPSDPVVVKQESTSDTPLPLATSSLSQEATSNPDSSSSPLLDESQNIVWTTDSKKLLETTSDVSQEIISSTVTYESQTSTITPHESQVTTSAEVFNESQSGTLRTISHESQTSTSSFKSDESQEFTTAISKTIQFTATSLLEIQDSVSSSEANPLHETTLKEPRTLQETASIEPRTLQETTSIEPHSLQETTSIEPDTLYETFSTETRTSQETISVEPHTLQETTSIEPHSLQETTSIEPDTLHETSSTETRTSQETTSIKPRTLQETTSIEPHTLQETTSIEPDTLHETSSTETRTSQETTSIKPRTLQETTSIEPHTLQETTSIEPDPFHESTSTETRTSQEITSTEPDTLQKTTLIVLDTLKETTSIESRTSQETTSIEPATSQETTSIVPDILHEITSTESRLLQETTSIESRTLEEITSTESHTLQETTSTEPHTFQETTSIEPDTLQETTESHTPPQVSEPGITTATSPSQETTHNTQSHIVKEITSLEPSTEGIIVTESQTTVSQHILPETSTVKLDVQSTHSVVQLPDDSLSTSSTTTSQNFSEASRIWTTPSISSTHGNDLSSETTEEVTNVHHASEIVNPNPEYSTSLITSSYGIVSSDAGSIAFQADNQTHTAFIPSAASVSPNESPGTLETSSVTPQTGAASVTFETSPASGTYEMIENNWTDVSIQNFSDDVIVTTSMDSKELGEVTTPVKVIETTINNESTIQPKFFQVSYDDLTQEQLNGLVTASFANSCIECESNCLEMATALLNDWLIRTVTRNLRNKSTIWFASTKSDDIAQELRTVFVWTPQTIANNQFILTFFVQLNEIVPASVLLSILTSKSDSIFEDTMNCSHFDFSVGLTEPILEEELLESRIGIIAIASVTSALAIALMVTAFCKRRRRSRISVHCITDRDGFQRDMHMTVEVGDMNSESFIIQEEMQQKPKVKNGEITLDIDGKVWTPQMQESDVRDVEDTKL